MDRPGSFHYSDVQNVLASGGIMMFEELLRDESDDALNLGKIVDEFDWDDDTLLFLDDEMAAQGEDEVGLNFSHGNVDLRDNWNADSVA